MKLKADRASLIKALAHIQSVAEKRNTIPILANALIAVRGRQAEPDRDRHGNRHRGGSAGRHQPGRRLPPRQRSPCTRSCANCPTGAEVELDFAGGDAQLALRAGRYATSPGYAAD